MFGSKKRHILADGTQAMAVVTDVDYVKVAGMAVASNYNFKLKLTLLVRPEGEAPFEAHHSGYFPQYAQPEVGDEFWVRYDPADRSKIELDVKQLAADNAAYEAQRAAQVAAAVPGDLAANGILGRGAIVDVQKTPVGPIIDCVVTVGVRLVDGTEPYRASCHLPLAPQQAEGLTPGGTFVTVRADPSNHARIAISLNEEIPVVTVTDPRALEPSVRALREGAACRVTILASQRQWLQTPDGQEFYAIKVRVDSDGSEFQVNLPVPPAAEAMLRDGMEFPAKRLVAEPNVLAIDWAAAGATAAAV